MVVDEILEVFTKRGYKWKFKDGIRPPDKEDIQGVIDAATETLYAEPNDTQVELGKIIVKKVNDHLDVYVFVGDLNDQATS